MQRLFFLDNLKSFVVNLMIVFHVGLCYIAAPLPWWYVLDSDLRIEMTYWILDTDMTIMPIMFFISGYFCVKSLAKGKNFWGPKWQRIGIPWLIGIAFLAPVASFLMPYSRGLTADFMTHLTEFYFFNPETGGPGVFYNHVPYWYLGVLMVFYAVAYGISKVWPSFKQLTNASSPKWWFFLLIGLFTFANCMIVDMITGDEYLWVPIVYLFVIQPSRILLYVLYFFLGTYAWRHHWFEDGCYVPSAAKWAPFLLVSAIFLPWTFCHSPQYVSSPLEFLFLISLSHAMLLTSAVYGLLGIFYKLFNYTNELLGNLASTSYTMYYCHILFVFLPVLYMLPMSISPFLKWFIACVISWPVTYIVGKLMLRLPLFADSKKAKVQ